MSAETLRILDAVSAGRIAPDQAADLIRFVRTSAVRPIEIEDALDLLDAIQRPTVRLMIRLDAPGGDGDAWMYRAFLTADGDASLMLPLPDAVLEPDAVPGGDATVGDAMQEWDRAVGIAPLLGTGRFPGEGALSTDEAYRFLVEAGQDLRDAGYDVRVPVTCVAPDPGRVTARGTVRSSKTPSMGYLTQDDLVRFDWEVALDGDEMTPGEFEALARGQVPLVRMRGRWLRLAEADLERIKRFWRERGDVTPGIAIGRALGTGPEEGVETVRAEGWISTLLEGVEKGPGRVDLRTPAGLRATLRPYQVRGTAWLAFLAAHGLGGCLADDMGLGKTVQVLGVILKRRDTGIQGPTLVVCPASVMTNWVREAERFAPDLETLLHHGAERPRDEAFLRMAADSGLVVTSYATLVRDAEMVRAIEWDGFVVDEAQNIKNADTLQARTVRSIHAAWRAALTGTPVENSVQDLWSILEFLNPGLLGSRRTFVRRYLVPIQKHESRPASEKLRRIVRPFVLRRLKSDPAVIRDLPDKLELNVPCGMTREQAGLYAAVVKTALSDIERATGLKRRGLILATLGKLRQVCNHPAQFLKESGPIADRAGKLAKLTDMLQEVVGEGDRALIFTQFTRMGRLLQEHLHACLGVPVPFLHGGVSRTRRDGMVRDFQEGDSRLLLLSLRAAGTGLNLTRAAHVFHYDRWWNPAVEDQATDRVYRIGQSRNVNVYKLICSGTIEDRMDEVLRRKRRVADRVVGPGEESLTDMSNEALRALFEMNREEDA